MSHPPVIRLIDGKICCKSAVESRSLAEWLSHCIALVKQRDWQGLLDWCREWTKRDTDDLGLITTTPHIYRDVIESYHKAIRINPKDAQAWNGIGETYHQLNRDDEAIEAYRQALCINPEDANTWYNLGNAYGNLKCYDDALYAYHQALRINPEHTNAWYNLGIIYSRAENLTAAMDVVRELRRIDPAQADELFNMIMPLTSDKTPRQILAEDFKSLGGELPIRGGWGYTQEDACIIDKDDPVVSLDIPFDGVGIEYIFVQKRIYEEMIIFRPDGEKFSGLDWKLIKQELYQDNDRTFDKLVFEITAFPDKDWDELKTEHGGQNGNGSPTFDLDAHMKKRQEKMITFSREFWFDITSFYGNDSDFTDETTKEGIGEEQDPDAYVSELRASVIAQLREIAITDQHTAQCLNLLRQNKFFDDDNRSLCSEFLEFLTTDGPLYETFKEINRQTCTPITYVLRDIANEI